MGAAQKLPRISKTKQVLAEMLTERVSISMLDSAPLFGGRHFEKNQGRDFEREPASVLKATITDYKGRTEIGLTVRHSLYHWLDSRLEFDGLMNRRFQSYAVAKKREGEPWLELMEQFPLFLRTRGEYTTRLDGEEAEAFEVFTTYEHDTLLPQNVQFVYFEVRQQNRLVPYVVLQIHGGADIRGGYTRPRVFRCFEESSIWDFGRGVIAADQSDKEREADQAQGRLFATPRPPRHLLWATKDGGYHWEDAGIDDYWGHLPNLEAYLRTVDPALRGKGHIYVNPDTLQAFCPVTGWLLSACWV